MRQVLIAVSLVFVGYAFGRWQSPARADDSDKIITALRDLVRAEERQVDTMRTIADRVRCR